MNSDINVSASDVILRIARDTDGLFDDEHLNTNLRVRVRVTVDVYKFFVASGDAHDHSELSYVLGTIQSGVDDFFLVGYACRSFNGLEESWLPEWPNWRSLAELKELFLKRFESLVGADTEPVVR